MANKFRTPHPIVVTDATRAAKLLCSTNTYPQVHACISIADPIRGARPPVEAFNRVPHRLSLTFDDVMTDGQGTTAPTAADVQRILDFGRATQIPEGKRLLIHCYAGQSRSTAAAAIILADRMGPGKEAEVFSFLLECCENERVFPNATMVSLADDLLGRGGKLREASGEVYCLGALLAQRVAAGDVDQDP